MTLGRTMTKTTDIPLEDWLDTGLVARRLGVTRRYVEKLCAAGKLKGVLLRPHLWLVHPKSVDDWKPQRRRKGGQSIE